MFDVLYGLFCVYIGFVAGHYFAGTDHRAYTMYQPMNISKAVLFQNGNFVTVPDDILLHIVDPKRIPTVCQDSYAVACAQTATQPCQLYLPANWEISYFPKDGKAEWSDYNHNETLVHEILHCYIPNWHDPYTERFHKMLFKQYGFDPSGK